MKNIAIAMLIIIVPLNGTILQRSTFEAWEGSLDWTTNTGGNGDVRTAVEDPNNDYQTQSHGAWSLRIQDPDNNSYANASKIFDNDASEYMVEFYLWIYHTHATIDSFPLCVLWNIPGEGLPAKTDIALVIDTLNNPPNGGLFTIHVQDADSIHHNEVYIDSTDRWYKIQIYRYVSGSDTVVTLYLDGDSIDTYVPMNKDKVSNKISLGTTQADSLADGEVFYDDVIISTPPVGEHPRLLFTASDTSSLRTKAGNDNPTTVGRSFKEIANSIKSYAHTLADDDTISIVVGADTHDFVHPFAYPADFDTCSSILLWNTLGGEIRARLVYFAFTHLLFPNSSIGDTSRVKAIEILSSLATWHQWVNPYADQGDVRNYFAIETSHLTYGASLAYDIVFDSLNNYDRMSLQNALLVLSIGQLYLESLYGVLGSNLGQEPPLYNGGNWANYFMFCNGALGLSINSVKPEFSGTPPELDTARSRIVDNLFQKDSICDPAGGYVEGILYSSVLDFVYLFGIADSIGNSNNSIINDSFFIKAPYFRVYAKAPGDSFNLSEGRRELNFGDSYESYPYVNGFLLKYAARNNDPLIQRYFKYTYHGQYYEYFLWMDASFDTTHPAGNMFGRLFPNIGWAVLRDGWRSEDYQIAIKSGRKVGHTHRDNNSIILGTNNRWLITDAGYCSYGDDTPRSWPINHNVLIVANNDSNPCDTTGIISRIYISENTPGETDSIFGYFRGDASNAYSELNKYIRDVVFVNKNPPFFVICDGVQSVANEDSFTWLFHTWGDVTYNADSQVVSIDDTVMHNDNEYLDIKVMWPDSIVYENTIIYDNQCSGDTTRTRIYLKKKYPVSTPSYEQFIAVLIPDHEQEVNDSTAKKIPGTGLIGTKVGNTAVMFGDHADSVAGGKYEVSVTDSLLNIVCNLVPDTNYLVIKKKGTDNETIDTLQTNDVGILSFKLYGSGNWKVIITLARTTGSIKINNDSTYCNMPFVALNLEMTNPLDSNSVDSMRIWQDYTVNDTLYTDSTGWIPVDSTYFWYLRQGEGTNIVYAQFMGNGWNESIEYCDSIVFDKTLPTGSFVINDDSTFANNSDVTLKNSLNDTQSGMSKMRFGHKYLKNIVKNSGFDTTTHWQTDTALYHDSLRLYEIPLQTIGNYFYQAIAPESLVDFVNDTLLLWIDLVSDGFVGDARVAFQYIYGADTAVRGTQPYGASITIPEGTNAKVSHYNLYSYFKYYPDPPVGERFIEARVGVFADSALRNSGRLFIDNFRLDVVSPADDYTRFEDHDTLKEWTLISGNGVRKVYGQFSDAAGNETAVSFDSIIVDTTKPVRRISYPQNGQMISDTITIMGWAHDSLDDPPHFKQYELQHQAQMSAIWYGNDPDSISYTPKYPIQVGQGQKPVAVGNWNTFQVNYGWYNLKLSVSDSASNSNDTTISVCVNNGGVGGLGGFSGFSNYVYGLAAGNQVYIGEFNTGKIYRYNTNYELIHTFKLVDSVGTGFPLAMAIDHSGKLWVANTNSHLISKFTSQGSLLLRFAGGFSLPSGFAFDNSGNIWVSDRLHHKIKKFNQDGDSLFAFGTQGSGPGEIDRPIGIAFHDNKIYIADSKNERISVFDTLGDFIEVIVDSAGLQMPFGVVIDSSGCLFVSDFLGDQVIEYDPYGNQLYKIDSVLDSPTGLALSPDANVLYVSDTRNKRVLAFQVRGEPPPGGGPQAYGDAYIDRLMFDVYPSLSTKQMNIRLQGFANRKISLKAYDVTGRVVKTFYDNQMIEFNQNISWDCRDNLNRKLSCGVYFIRLETKDYKKTKKVILLE